MTLKNSLIWWGVADAVTRGPPAATKGPEEYRGCLYRENPARHRLTPSSRTHTRRAHRPLVDVAIPHAHHDAARGGSCCNHRSLSQLRLLLEAALRFVVNQHLASRLEPERVGEGRQLWKVQSRFAVLNCETASESQSRLLCGLPERESSCLSGLPNVIGELQLGELAHCFCSRSFLSFELRTQVGHCTLHT